jgi:hypothetical protein
VEKIVLSDTEAGFEPARSMSRPLCVIVWRSETDSSRPDGTTQEVRSILCTTD